MMEILITTPGSASVSAICDDKDELALCARITKETKVPCMVFKSPVSEGGRLRIVNMGAFFDIKVKR